MYSSGKKKRSHSFYLIQIVVIKYLQEIFNSVFQ